MTSTNKNTHGIRPCSFVRLLSFLALFSIASNQLLADDFRTVALTGQTAAGLPQGNIFNSFSAPALNAQGQTAFTSFLKSGGTTSNGVWSEGPGTLSLVASAGGAAPGTPAGALFSSFNSYVTLNDNGRTAFYGYLQHGPGGVGNLDDEGLWAQGDSGLALVARLIDSSPGTSSGEYFITIGPSTSSSDQPKLYSFTNSNEAAFVGDMGGTTSSLGHGIWVQLAGATTLLVRSGSQAPDAPDGVTLGQFNTRPAVSDGGKFAIYTPLQGASAGVTTANDTGILVGAPGSLHLLAREGEQAPGLPVGTHYGQFITLPAINSHGDVAFSSTYAQITAFQFSGLWANKNGVTRLVESGDMQAPGASAGIKFQFVESEKINHSGDVAFLGYLQAPTGGAAPSVADHGIWKEVNGQLQLVARTGYFFSQPTDPIDVKTGTPVPGFPADSGFFMFTQYVFNAAGQVAFTASATGGNGIWAEDRSGVLRLIVRNGSVIDVDNGPGIDLRTVSTIRFAGSSGNDGGEASAFNDAGQIAFAAIFTDGSQGVFVSNIATVPEPAASAMILIAALSAARYRRRPQTDN